MKRRNREVIALDRCGYEVVHDGAAVRLEGPLGTLSYYHPRQPFTGFAWDALTAATLLVRREIRCILILGLGGGTLARQLRLLAPEARITGVEAEDAVLEAARRHFRLDESRVEIVRAWSQDYLRKTRMTFDAVLDDVWPAETYEQRPVRAEPCWASLVHQRLSSEGIYAVTAFRRSEDRQDIPSIIDRMGTTFGSACEVRPREGGTTVLAFALSLLTGRSAHRRRRQAPESVREGLEHVKYYRIQER